MYSKPNVALPILGGHVLMATDSPKEMGFALAHGNNKHICLEPSTRGETTRLFDSLSQKAKSPCLYRTCFSDLISAPAKTGLG